MIDDTTLQALEYHEIAGAVAALCAFSASRDLARALRPFTDLERVRQAQAETSAAVRLVRLRPEVSVGGARDVRPLVARAGAGALLAPEELLEVEQTLTAANGLRTTVLKASEQNEGVEEMASLAGDIRPLHSLVSAVRAAVNERAEVVDSASPELGRVRREMRVAQHRVVQQLRAIISSPQYAPALQENLITQREGRFVVPVKAEYRTRVPGIVHDTSGSGQTLFIEPLGVVEMANRVRELRKREEEEIEKVLRALSSEVASAGPEITSTVDHLARIDFALARARFALRLRAVEPLVPGAGGSGPAAPLELVQARHPLLTGDVVPLSLSMGSDYRILVITGPNTGGKTVALKTVGLLVLMAQSGLHVPASPGTSVPVFSTVAADIGDEQSIQQSLSTFSSHMQKIIRMLAGLGPGCLLLLDELGAGTDPEEGAALARAIIDHVLDAGCLAVATTHYSELKSYAHSTPGVRNASVEFDVATLSPTYRLLVGLPGRSNALAIARRLGMPDGIVRRAEADVDPHSRALDEMLLQIQAERDAAAAARARAEQQLQETRARATELERELAEARDRREEAAEEGRRQAEAELESFRIELADLRAAAARLRHEPPAVEVFEQAEASARSLSRRLRSRIRREPRPEQRPLRPGDTVLVQTLGAQGVVSSVDGDTAEVRVGRMKSRVPLSQLKLQPAHAEQHVGGRTSLSIEPRGDVSAELDLRGRRAEEVAREVERYLEDAYLAGLPYVRIIHGKGTGVLRQVVRDAVRVNPLVQRSEGESDRQGGEGVTVAWLTRRNA